MKIVLAAYLHGYGGAEHQILMLANSLIEYSHEVYVLALADKNIRFELSPKVKVIYLTKAERGRLRIAKRFIAYSRAIKEIKPDLTIHYWMQSAYFSTLLPRSWRGKIVYSERGDPFDSEFDGLLGIIRKISFKYIDGFVFQSEGARDFFNKEIRQRSTVIHNPVTVNHDYDWKFDERSNRIVTVGRLHPQKNQKLLINAFSQISNQLSDYILEIYGEGVLKEELERQIEELGLANRVFIREPRKNIFSEIHNASLFVLSSDFEGMPNVLLEAMALGMPCLSTDCRPGGARALIEDGKSGIIVPVRNVEALAEKIEFLVTHPDVASEYGRKARLVADSHTPEEIFSKWNSFLKELQAQ